MAAPATAPAALLLTSSDSHFFSSVVTLPLWPLGILSSLTYKMVLIIPTLPILVGGDIRIKGSKKEILCQHL